VAVQTQIGSACAAKEPESRDFRRRLRIYTFAGE